MINIVVITDLRNLTNVLISITGLATCIEKQFNFSKF